MSPLHHRMRMCASSSFMSLLILADHGSPHTATICVLILLYMSFICFLILLCVLILLYVCPHTTISVSRSRCGSCVHSSHVSCAYDCHRSISLHPLCCFFPLRYFGVCSRFSKRRLEPATDICQYMQAM